MLQHEFSQPNSQKKVKRHLSHRKLKRTASAVVVDEKKLNKHSTLALERDDLKRKIRKEGSKPTKKL